MSEDYRKGFREALRQLKRDVDAHPGWGTRDIYDRLSELANVTEPSGDQRTSNLLDRVAYLETQERATLQVFNEQRALIETLQKRTDALDKMHEGQPAKTTAWEKGIEARLEALERAIARKRR